MRDKLYPFWLEACASCRAAADAVETGFEAVMNLLNEPHRFYHNAGHIYHLLTLYDEYKTKLDKKSVVVFSIFYHDAVYVPGRSDNEHKSAGMAEEKLKKLYAADDVIANVVAFILATKNHHAVTARDNDRKYFLDFDLSILAADKEAYAVYVKNIRKEYSFLPAEQFAAGRKAFVQNALRLPHLFFTPDFRRQEEAARQNLQRELTEYLRHI